MKTAKSHFQYLIELNIAMLFVSTSGPLGRYVSLPVPVVIGLRALLALVFLVLYCRWKGISLKIEKRHIIAIMGSGLLMGAHWITYFYALKLSNVAIGMLAMFTYPILTAFLEPLLLKTRFERIHLVLALIVLVGIYFLVPDFSLGNSMTVAVLFGVVSALFYALRNLILKTKVGAYNGSMLMCYQMMVVGVLLLPIVTSVSIDVLLVDWKPVLALALMTTAVGHTLFLNSFKHFSVTSVSILSSIQPIFGIILGALFLDEIPRWTTLVGGALILGSVVIESIRSKKASS